MRTKITVHYDHYDFFNQQRNLSVFAVIKRKCNIAFVQRTLFEDVPYGLRRLRHLDYATIEDVADGDAEKFKVFFKKPHAQFTNAQQNKNT